MGDKGIHCHMEEEEEGEEGEYQSNISGAAQGATNQLSPAFGNIEPTSLCRCSILYLF